MLFGNLNTMDEQFPSKVVASFETSSDAKRAATRLSHADEVETGQILIIAPGDNAADSKLQPEARAIENSFIRKHLKYGIAGLLAGVFLSTLAVNWGPDIFTASPLLTSIAVTWVTFLSSLMLAGALTLRMDHDLVFNHAQRASDQGKYVVVAHARSGSQKRRFAEQLDIQAQATAASL